METRSLGLVGAAALAAGLALTSAEATAGADAWQHQGITPAAWQGDHGRSAPTADLSLVHGVPALNVDIYVVKNLFSYKEFKNVHFGTATDVSTDYPGWVTPAFYVVDVVPTGGRARVTVRHLAVAPRSASMPTAQWPSRPPSPMDRPQPRPSRRAATA